MRDAALFIPVIITFVLLFYRLICMGVTKDSRAVRPLRITAVLLVILAIATASISIALALYKASQPTLSAIRERYPVIRGYDVFAYPVFAAIEAVRWIKDITRKTE